MPKEVPQNQRGPRRFRSRTRLRRRKWGELQKSSSPSDHKGEKLGRRAKVIETTQKRGGQDAARNSVNQRGGASFTSSGAAASWFRRAGEKGRIMVGDRLSSIASALASQKRKATSSDAVGDGSASYIAV